MQLISPEYKQGLPVAPMLKITIGDWFVDTPIIIDSFTLAPNENSPWELDEGKQLPFYLDLTIGGKVLFADKAVGDEVTQTIYARDANYFGAISQEFKASGIYSPTEQKNYNMKRYELNRKKRDKHLRTVYGTILYPKIERKDTDLYVMSRLGDRLDNLAMEFYKDVTLWWIIAQANNIGKGTMNVEIGTTLRIPQQTDVIIEDYNEIVRNRKII